MLYEHFVGADILLGQMVQCRLERTIAARTQQLADRFGEQGFPIQIFDPAARAVQGLGKTDQAGRIAGQTRSGGAACTGHDVEGSKDA